MTTTTEAHTNDCYCDDCEADRYTAAADQRATERAAHEDRMAWFAAHPNHQHPAVWL